MVPLRQSGEAGIPGDVALILETGCIQCDGPTTGLLRVYTRPDGSPLVDTLLDPAALGLGTRQLTTPKGVEEESPYITGFDLSEDASEIMVSICIQQTCGSGGLDAWSPGSETALLRSTNGGATWERVGTVDVGGFVVHLLGQGRAIIGTWDVNGGPPVLRTFPGLEKASLPVPDAWPMFVREGEIIWRTADGRSLLLPNGDEPIDFGPDAQVVRVSSGSGWAQDAELMVLWVWRDSHYYLSLLDGSGRLIRTYEYARFLLLAPVGLDKGLAIGNADFDVSHLPDGAPNYLSAIFDLGAGTVSPILDPFADPDFPRGRNHIVGVMRGFFSRVQTPGSCLNVRAEPSLSASILECAADRVLLRGIGQRHAGETVEAEGVTWLHVLAPDGVEGWADTAFLGQ